MLKEALDRRSPIHMIRRQQRVARHNGECKPDFRLDMVTDINHSYYIEHVRPKASDPAHDMKPRRFEEFQALVDRAFCALWQRLHLFDQMLAKEKRELGQELEAMGEGVPEYADDVEERRERIGRVLDTEATEQKAKTLYLECQRRLGQLLNLRFGFGPASRFLQSPEWDDPDWEEWDDDADWAEAR